MEYLIIVGTTITFRDKVYTYKGYVLIDSTMIHLQLENESMYEFCFVIADTTINGRICSSAEEFILELA